MKKYLVLFIFQTLSFTSYTQEDKLRIIPNYDNDSSDLFGILNLLNIDIIKFKLSNNFINHKVNLVIDEYKNGNVKEVYNTQTKLSKAIQNWTLILNDSLERTDFEIRFYIRKNDTILNYYLNLVRGGFENHLTLKRGKSYSYKSIYNLDNNKHQIVLGEKFPIWTYTQPVAKKAQIRKYENEDGIAEFCSINGEIIPFIEWYKVLGIEHFFIFSIIVEKEL